MAKRAADLMVEALEAYGIERVWCVPGESYLTLLDALCDSEIETIQCRHESGAGFMAVSESKLTGRPAVFMVSRGPGATNGSIALHVAEQDATPVILLIGQVSREERGKGAFQEMDYEKFFGSVAKGVWEVSEVQNVVPVMAEAFELATSGTPGPVVISMPEDMLGDAVDGTPRALQAFVPAEPDPEQVAEVAALISRSERPLIMAGGSLRAPRGQAALAAVAEWHRAPVAAMWKHQDIFDNTSPLYAGHLGFGSPAAHVDVLKQADLIIAVGTRLGDVTTQGYTLPRSPEPDQTLVHVHADSAVIGRNFRTDIAACCDPVAFLEQLVREKSTVPAPRETWLEEINSFVSGFTAFTARETDDGVDYGRVVDAFSRLSSDDAIILTDAGNISSWVHRNWKMTPKNVLVGGVAGAMGLGVPGAVTASYLNPGRQAIVVVGDGGILMTGQEIATAMHLGATPIIVVSNNSSYGTIRLHQEKHHPGRISATDLTNPDFCKWAESFGAKALRIERDEDVEPMVEAALAGHDVPVVVEVISSRESLSAFVTLSQFRAAAE
ncbi:MAG: thiamine pyrophosphate-dependent enzyme [Pseudomonadota bacterium]